MTEKKKVGKPRLYESFSAEQLAQVEALGAVLSVEQIADYFGMGRTTFYAYIERQPEISEHYKRGKAKAIQSVSNGLLQKALEGDTASTIFYLKTQAGWKETQVVETQESEKASNRHFVED